MAYINDKKVLTKIINNGSGGVNLNVHYGDQAPSDTTKLWIKTNNVPNKVRTEMDLPSNLIGEITTDTLPNGNNYVYINGYNYRAVHEYQKRVYIERTDSNFENATIFFPLDISSTTNSFQYTYMALSYSDDNFSIIEHGRINRTFRNPGFYPISMDYCYKIEKNGEFTLLYSYSQDQRGVTSDAGEYLNTMPAYDVTTNRIYYRKKDTIFWKNLSELELEYELSLNTSIPTTNIAHLVAYANIIRVIYKSNSDNIYTIGLEGDVSSTTFSRKISNFLCQRGRFFYIMSDNTLLKIDIETLEIIQEKDIGVATNEISFAANDIYLQKTSRKYQSYAEYKIRYKLSESKELNNNELVIICQNYNDNGFNFINTDTINIKLYPSTIYLGNSLNKAETIEGYLYKNDSWVKIT